MNGFHGQLQKAKDDPLKWRDRRVKSPGSRYKRESAEKWHQLIFRQGIYMLLLNMKKR